MLDDASFYTFVPSLQNGGGAADGRPRRKTAIFASQSVCLLSIVLGNVDLYQQAPGAIFNPLAASNLLDTSRETTSPPKATIARRAQSYTDFHHAARAWLRNSNDSSKKTPQIKDELQFAEWYESIEEGLLEAGQNEFKYGIKALLRNG